MLYLLAYMSAVDPNCQWNKSRGLLRSYGGRWGNEGIVHLVDGVDIQLVMAEKNPNTIQCTLGVSIIWSGWLNLSIFNIQS